MTAADGGGEQFEDGGFALLPRHTKVRATPYRGEPEGDHRSEDASVSSSSRAERAGLFLSLSVPAFLRARARRASRRPIRAVLPRRSRRIEKRRVAPRRASDLTRPPPPQVRVTGNNRTKSSLIGLTGVVKKSVGLGGWHWLVRRPASPLDGRSVENVFVLLR